MACGSEVKEHTACPQGLKPLFLLIVARLKPRPSQII
jgi:hypothetical protein